MIIFSKDKLYQTSFASSIFALIGKTTTLRAKNFLAELDANFAEASAGGIIPTSNILQWNSEALRYQVYPQMQQGTLSYPYLYSHSLTDYDSYSSGQLNDVAMGIASAVTLPLLYAFNKVSATDYSSATFSRLGEISTAYKASDLETKNFLHPSLGIYTTMLSYTTPYYYGEIGLVNTYEVVGGTPVIKPTLYSKDGEGNTSSLYIRASDIYIINGTPSKLLALDQDNRIIYVDPQSGTESDPVFAASAAYGITSTNITNWNTAYSWGNHATAGYALSSHTHTLETVCATGNTYTGALIAASLVGKDNSSSTNGGWIGNGQMTGYNDEGGLYHVSADQILAAMGYSGTDEYYFYANGYYIYNGTANYHEFASEVRFTNGTAGKWVVLGSNKELTFVDPPISGLNAGYIPVAFSSTGIQDSALYQSGTRLGLNMTGTPNQMLELQYGHLRFTTVPSPPAGMTATLAGAGAGNVDNGTHYYYVKYVCEFGETGYANASAASVVVVDNTTNGKVLLENIPVAPDSYKCTARKIYRTTISSQYTAYRLTTINNNTTTTFIDNIADANLVTSDNWYNSSNTTAGKIYVNDQLVFFTDAYLTAVGYQAGLAGAYGGSNTLIGSQAGKQVYSGQGNTMIGYTAGWYVTSGGGNTAIGNTALRGSATTANCTAIGSGSLTSASGNYNTAIGVNSGNRIVSGAYNTAIGGYAGGGAQKRDVTYSMAIGYGTNTTKNYTTVIGNSLNQKECFIAGDVYIRREIGYGSQVLGNPTLTTSAGLWTAAGDCTLTGDKAVFTYSTGSATLTQSSSNFLVTPTGNVWYKFTYTVSGVNAASNNIQATISTSFASEATWFYVETNGIFNAYFRSTAIPGDFVISLNLIAGQTVTLDTFTLTTCPGGDLYVARDIYAGGQYTSWVADGTAPFVITSTTVNTNLNADLLDGNHSSAFALSGHTHSVTDGIFDLSFSSALAVAPYSTKTGTDPHFYSYNFDSTHTDPTVNNAGIAFNALIAVPVFVVIDAGNTSDGKRIKITRHSIHSLANDGAGNCNETFLTNNSLTLQTYIDYEFNPGNYSTCNLSHVDGGTNQYGHKITSEYWDSELTLPTPTPFQIIASPVYIIGGNFGVGLAFGDTVTSPVTVKGDIEVIRNSGTGGLILADSNGVRWRVSMNTDGTLSISSI